MNKTFIAGLAGALAVLFVVGAFLALDRTTLHWYSGEAASQPRATSTRPARTPTPEEASFSFDEAISIVLSALGNKPGPPDTTTVECTNATYHSQNHTWLVNCHYWDKNTAKVELGAFPVPNVPVVVIMDDGTGAVTLP